MAKSTPDTQRDENHDLTTIPQGRQRRLRLYLVRHGESQANQEGVFAGQLDSPLTKQGVIDAKSLGERSEFSFSQQTTQSQTQGTNQNHRGSLPLRFDAVYSSDLVRAHDTCKLILEGIRTRHQNNLDNRAHEDQSRTAPEIASPLPCDIRLDRRLRERSYGTLQGMPWSSDRSETDKKWRDTHEKDELPPIFETDDDIWIRVKEFLSDLVRDELSTTTTTTNTEILTKHILITSHGGVLRQILMRLVGVEKLKKMGATFDTKRKNRLITPNTSLTILDLSDRYKPHPADSAGETTEENRYFREDGDNSILKGMQVEILVYANTNHLEGGGRIHDD